jgi:hypothetical protein
MGKVRFRQADLQRVFRAAKAEGVAIDIEFDPDTGKIKKIITKDAEGAGSSSPLDDWLANNARASERH